MGKNKWYNESESEGIKQKGSSSSGQSNFRHKKSNFAPSQFVLDSPEHMPIPKLFGLVFQRLKRRWIAFRFQANRWSFGIFRMKTALQLGVLSLAGYFLFGPDGESGLLTGPGKAVNWARETTLSVGAEHETIRKAKKPSAKNEAAPVNSDDLISDQSLDYIERFHKIAMGEMQQFGIPASISLAQGLIESRAGTSKLAQSNNNHFGIKCFSKHCKKGHCTNFTDDSHKDFFRNFTTPWECWRAHSQLLASGRYAKLKRYGRDYKAWANGLKSIGYATDRGYADKLIGIIERYNLHKYDN